MAERFLQKSQTLKDIDSTAHKQSGAYKQATKSLTTKKLKNYDKDIELLISGPKALLRLITRMTASDWGQMSNSLSDCLIAVAEQFRQKVLVLVRVHWQKTYLTRKIKHHLLRDIYIEYT